MLRHRLVHGITSYGKEYAEERVNFAVLLSQMSELFVLYMG